MQLRCDVGLKHMKQIHQAFEQARQCDCRIGNCIRHAWAADLLRDEDLQARRICSLNELMFSVQSVC